MKSCCNDTGNHAHYKGFVITYLDGHYELYLPLPKTDCVRFIAESNSLADIRSNADELVRAFKALLSPKNPHTTHV